MNRGAITLAVAALLVGLAVGSGFDRPSEAPGAAGAGTEGRVPDAGTVPPSAAGVTAAPGSMPAAATDAVSTPNIATARFSTPLPPEDTPLVSALPALQAAAEAGSIEAIRRLLRDTRRCQAYTVARRKLDIALYLQEERTDLVESSDLEMAAHAANRMMPTHTLCAGHQDPDGVISFEAQWRAALAGDLEGLLRFALDPDIDTERAWEEFDRIERYREHASNFLHQALAAGSAQAALHLMRAHDPRMQGAFVRDSRGASIFPPSPIRQVLRQDAAMTWRYATLCERVCPDHAQERARRVLDRLRPALDAETRARAEEEAARLREAHFARVREVPWFPDLNDQPAPGGPPSGP